MTDIPATANGVAPAAPKRRRRRLQGEVKAAAFGMRNHSHHPSAGKRSDPRSLAANAYTHWLKHPSRIESLIESTLARNPIADPADRGLFNELLYGVIRRKARLDWLLGELAHQGKLPEGLPRAAATLGLYQLLFLDRIPDYAAVDTAVSLARRSGDQAASRWVNAILRRVASDQEFWRDHLPNSADETYNLSIAYSLPVWLVDRWRRRYSPQVLQSLLRWSNRIPPLSLRANLLKTDSANLIELLQKDGHQAIIHPADERFIQVKGGGNPATLPGFGEGLFSVQDASQGLAPRLLDPQPGEKALDICAAPGGKTGYLAELCPTCKITATDKSPERMESLRELLRRASYPNVELCDYQDALHGADRFDAVLVDAPCTGTGVLARRVDLRWRLSPSEIPRMAALQLQLLRYAAGLLKPGGRIIYSTCTLEPDENENIVQAFLKEDKRFTRSETRQSPPAPGGILSELNPEFNDDDAFAVRLELRR